MSLRVTPTDPRILAATSSTSTAAKAPPPSPAPSSIASAQEPPSLLASLGSLFTSFCSICYALYQEFLSLLLSLTSEDEEVASAPSAVVTIEELEAQFLSKVQEAQTYLATEHPECVAHMASWGNLTQDIRAPLQRNLEAISQGVDQASSPDERRLRLEQAIHWIDALPYFLGRQIQQQALAIPCRGIRNFARTCAVNAYLQALVRTHWVDFLIYGPPLPEEAPQEAKDLIACLRTIVERLRRGVCVNDQMQRFYTLCRQVSGITGLPNSFARFAGGQPALHHPINHPMIQSLSRLINLQLGQPDDSWVGDQLVLQVQNTPRDSLAQAMSFNGAWVIMFPDHYIAEFVTAGGTRQINDSRVQPMSSGGTITTAIAAMDAYRRDFPRDTYAIQPVYSHHQAYIQSLPRDT